MKRLALTAKAFGAKPSDYLPELSTYERFAVDEACAYILAVVQEQQLDELKSGRRQDAPKPSRSVMDMLKDPRFKAPSE